MPWHMFEPFELVDTVTGIPALEQTAIRACWCPDCLFVQFICEDRHIASDFLNRDDPLYEQDVVELFFDEHGNGTHYLELEVSPFNIVFNARIENDGFGNTVRIDKEWNFVGLRTNVHSDAPADLSTNFKFRLVILTARSVRGCNGGRTFTGLTRIWTDCVNIKPGVRQVPPCTC